MNSDLPIARRAAIALALALGAAMPAKADEATRSLWLISRVDSIPRLATGSLAHCQEMERSQRLLLARRDSIASVQKTGRDRRAFCKDAECERSLQALRDSLASLHGRAEASRLILGQESSLCPAAVWKRWQKWRTLDSLAETPGDSSGSRATDERIQERAELAWAGTLEAMIARSPGTIANAERLVADRFASPSASCTWRLRQAFVLQWTDHLDSALPILERIAGRRDCPEESSLAHHWLGSEPTLGDSTRMIHLRASLRRIDVRGRSLLELSSILARRSRWTAAFDSLALALRCSPELLAPQRIDSLARWADQAGLDPLKRLADSAPWLDQVMLARGRLLLATGRVRAAQVLLADFRLRFPASPFGEEARELLARSRH